MSAGLIDSERLSAAHSHYQCCLLCEHRCRTDRAAGELGRCKAPAVARVFRHRIEYSEEMEISPSHLFYLSGCDLRCAFCIAEANAFDATRGRPLTPEFFAEAVAWGRKHGAHNVQWVGGEPTIHIPAVFDAMAACRPLPRIVWKSDFYGSPEAFKLLAGVVDVYVADFKFGADECARRVAGVDRYLETITRNLAIAASQADLIVRHLLLPGHFDCCYRPVIAWLSQNMPTVKFSLRDGYQPRWRARHYDELAAPLAPEAAIRAERLATLSGLRIIE
jgi:putative pyruvate formate lyase activating enzyme